MKEKDKDKENYIDKDTELFYARVRELTERADRGEVAVSEFYTPREVHYAESFLRSLGYGGRFAFFGGYRGAERQKLVCLPEYALYGADGENLSDENADALFLTASEFAGEEIKVLLITGSGFKNLTHRDFMGAILSLGVKRSVIGDISVSGNEAYVFCDPMIAEYIKTNLERVGRDTVKVKMTSVDVDFSPEKRSVTVSDTVASMRADCIIAALINCSRDSAKEYVRAGLVEVNYEPLSKPDAAINESDVVSVRGKGKFKLVKTDGTTKRGRLRLVAEKYI